MNRGRSRGGGSQFNRRPFIGGPLRHPVANYAVGPPYRQPHMNYDPQFNPQMGMHPRMQNQGRWMGPRSFNPRDSRNYNNQRYGGSYQPEQEDEPLQTYYYTSGISQPVRPEVQQQEKSSESTYEDTSQPHMVFRSHKMTSSEDKPAESAKSAKKSDVRKRREPEKLSEDCTMAERLANELSNESYECMICCEPVRVQDYIWSCGNCFNMFHLKCVQIWSESVLKSSEEMPGSFPAPDVTPATSSRNGPSSSGRGNSNRNMMIADLYLHIYANARNNVIQAQQEGENNPALGNTVAGWRCPACQYVVKSGSPKEYKCFCGKLTQPEFIPGDVPHTCGEMCGKKGRSENCAHPCTLLCHPGPCPPCEAMVTSSCDCGNITLTVRCDKANQLKCDQPCGKELMCKKHKCAKICHPSNCGLCEELMEVDCFCGKDKMKTLCADTVKQYSCKKVCDKTLDCGNHKCEDVCHSGDCTPCKASTSVVTSCHCGKMQLGEGHRKSCLDPVPTCKKKCGKMLHCGSQGTKHRCDAQCHPGDCPPCPLETKKRCRCGANTLTVNCVDLDGDGNVMCNRICKKKLHCNKHQCRKLCCTEDAHVCTATCNRLLSCGIHYCIDNCHRGYCDRCWEMSFDDLTCHCGRSVIPAPVPCGTSAPSCDYPCVRQHPCGHTPQHNCHSEDKCPPCPVLIQSMCLGDHQLMNSVPCYIQKLSCGRPCGKGLPNCDHLCSQTCHSGACIQADQSCQQKCQQRRVPCGHACDEVCHYGQGDCPDTPCRKPVQITCECGRVKEQIPCHEQQRMYQEKKDELSRKLSEISLDDTEEQRKTIMECQTKMERSCFLPCKDSCRRETWLRRLDDAFGPMENNANVQFTESLLRASTTGGYSDLVYELEQVFYNLVQECMNTGMKQQHKFKPMNSSRRQIIHELAEFYGLDSQAFDEEPLRHVAVYAYRNKVKIPPMSLTALASKRKTATSNTSAWNRSPQQFNSNNVPTVLQRQHEQVFCRDVGNPGVKTNSSSGAKSWSSAVGQSQPVSKPPPPSNVSNTSTNSNISSTSSYQNQLWRTPNFSNASINSNANSSMNYADLLNDSHRSQSQTNQPSPMMNFNNKATSQPSSERTEQPSGNRSLFSSNLELISNELSFQSNFNNSQQQSQQQFGVGLRNEDVGLNLHQVNWLNMPTVSANADSSSLWNRNHLSFQQQSQSTHAGYFPTPQFLDYQ